jgi:hypothetical protein
MRKPLQGMKDPLHTNGVSTLVNDQHMAKIISTLIGL